MTPCGRPRRMPGLAALALVLVFFPILGGCAEPGPRDVRAGTDQCAHCRMQVTVEGFASQLLTDRGRPYLFDSIECMAEFLAESEEVPEERIGSLWVSDFMDPERWLPAEEAVYLRSEAIRSPMGMNLSAYADRGAAERQRAEYPGDLLSWDEVRALVEEPGVSGEGALQHDHPATGDGVKRGVGVGAGDGTGGEIGIEPGADIGELAPPGLQVGGGGAFLTLGEAIAAAEEGDTIRVRGGHYREFPLEINRSLTLIGEDLPILDGEGSHSILIVRADGVTIEGFELRGAGVSHTRDHAAILVEDASRCRIIGNRFEDNFFGIYLARASDCIVRDNELRASGTRESNSGNGIHLWDVERVQIEENRIRGHRDGIYLEFARGALIRGNRSEGNLRYGLHFMFSDESFYIDNVFRGNGAGVAVMYTRDVVMAGNRFEDNWGTASYGLLLKDVQDSAVEDNLFRRNTIAIHSEGTDRVTFRLNRFERNGWAVRVLGSSQDNHFTANDFIDNTFDVTTNSRRNPNTFDGNYWSSYRGYDLAGDGRGDVPHRPVRLFAYIVERRPVALILLRSFFVEILEVAERVLPVLTPETLIDENPRMTEVPR